MRISYAAGREGKGAHRGADGRPREPPEGCRKGDKTAAVAGDDVPIPGRRPRAMVAEGDFWSSQEMAEKPREGRHLGSGDEFAFVNQFEVFTGPRLGLGRWIRPVGARARPGAKAMAEHRPEAGMNCLEATMILILHI